jgi:hypothetical protein
MAELDEQAERKAAERGMRAQKLIESAEWVEAWSAYRDLLLGAMERAHPDAQEEIKHLKVLLAGANVARAHLEKLMRDGKVAAQSLQLAESNRVRDRVRRIFG